VATNAATFEDAIARAGQARAAIDHIVSSVRSGERDLPAAFAVADEDSLIGRCFAVKVFEAVPGIGKVRARRTMEALGVAEDIWLGDVDQKARAAIVVAFGEA